MLGICNLETGGVVRNVSEGKWRISIGAVGGERVQGDPPSPAHHPEIELEPTSRVTLDPDAVDPIDYPLAARVRGDQHHRHADATNEPRHAYPWPTRDLEIT